MSALVKDLKVKLTEEDHAFLNAVALGMQRDSQSIVRDLIRDFLAAKRHEHRVLSNILEGERLAGDSRGRHP